MKVSNYIGENRSVAVVKSDIPIITDGQSALDTIMSVIYNEDTSHIAIEKKAFDEDFFILSKGLAGDVLQKFINYNVTAAIFGDFSKYTSEPLHALIRESNRGKDVFFVATEEEAIQKLLSI